MASTPRDVARRYFGNLNYTLANEDTAFELSVLREPVDHVAAVAGSGCRVLPLIGLARTRVTCIDLAAPQLFLTELRIAAARALDLAGYRAFLGYPPSPASPEERRRLFRALTLSAGARAFWTDHFAREEWRSPLYDGRWERTFARLARANRALTGEAGARLFEARTLEEQRAYVASGFPRAGWKRVLRLLGNAAVFNALLYRGSFPRKNTPGSHYELYDAAFSRLFERTLARENFFLQLVFFGEVRFAEGCPEEAQPVPFARAKEALERVLVDYRIGDAIAQATELPLPIDFLSLSDIASYFKGEREQTFLQSIRPALSARGRVVVRSYLHVPEGLDTTGFVRETEAIAEASRGEKVGVYDLDVYRRADAGDAGPQESCASRA
jgi:S-adenosylmethionine-diacylglycerol 3-amino-3-carboxypropyl transferase